MTLGMKIILKLVFVSYFLSLVSSAKILSVFPTPSISHQIVFRTVILELVRRGHEVTVITTDPAFPKGQAPLNLIEIDVHDLSYEIWTDFLLKGKTGSEEDHSSQVKSMLRMVSKIFKTQLLSTEEVQGIINKKAGHYDLLLLEAYVKPTLVFTHIFKAPAIQISSFDGLQYNFEVFGVPMHPLLYPPLTNQRIYNLSFYEKLQQLYKQWSLERSYHIIEQEDNKMLQSIFGPNIPSIKELSNNIDMLFLNVHSIWKGNQPVPPNVVHIGGIHTRLPKALPKANKHPCGVKTQRYQIKPQKLEQNSIHDQNCTWYLQDVDEEEAVPVMTLLRMPNFLPTDCALVYCLNLRINDLLEPRRSIPSDMELLLNESINGVIYFSLGTNVNTTNLPPDKVRMMMKVFSNLPYDVIWKWDQDAIPGRTENIKLFKWVPQADLLKHPKIKLFITQGGLQSTDEAIDAGVPVIGIPMLADQWYNTEKYQYHKIGIKLDLTDLTEEVFRKTIDTVISDKSYRENMIRLRTLMKDEPRPPLENAVWWIEYTLRHGGAKHLRAASANISWAQYLELELVAIVLLFLFSALFIFVLILNFLKKFITKVLSSLIKIKKS